MTRRNRMSPIIPSLENTLLNINKTMRRSWCYRRITLAVLGAICMLVLFKLSSPMENDGKNEDSYYQDTNALNKRIDKIARRRKLKANGTGQYCYRNDDEFGETIVFINFNNKWTDLDSCAVKTAALFNTHTPICLLHGGPENIETIESSLRGVLNVQVAVLDVLQILEGTPLHEWYHQVAPESTKRKYYHTELLDALRVSYLYKYGGTYLDTDVWALRSFETLEPNTIAKEAAHLPYLSNFVMTFQKGHPFLYDVLQQFNETVNPDRWGSSGTLLISKLYDEKWKGKNEKRKNVNAINVIKAESFYPVHFGNGPILFQARKFHKVVELTKQAYTVHLWREVYRSYWTGNSMPQRRSFVWTIYNQFCQSR